MNTINALCLEDPILLYSAITLLLSICSVVELGRQAERETQLVPKS